MQVQTQTRSGNPALQNGLLFGIILGSLEVAFYLTLGNVGFLICLILYLIMVGLAGYRASARTGKVSTGLVAGLLTGLFSSTIGSLGLFIYLLQNIDAFRQLLQQQAVQQGLAINYTNNVVIALVVLLLVIVILVSSSLALGIGAAGGAIGKGKAPVPPAPVPPYPYPYPYPGQYPDPRYMPPPTYAPQEYIPPQANLPSPQNYPPKPEDYMTPPPEK